MSDTTDLFDAVYLEETYVSSIHLGRELRIGLDCALLPGHRLYSPPVEGTVHTYASATLVFHTVGRVVWDDPTDVVYTDGESSWLGEVDEFARDADGTWSISGAYGTLRIWADGVELRWAAQRTPTGGRGDR